MATTDPVMDERLLEVLDAGLELHHKRASVQALKSFVKHVSKKDLSLDSVRAMCWLSPKDYVLSWEVKDDEGSQGSTADTTDTVKYGGFIFALEVRAKGTRNTRLKRAKEALGKCKDTGGIIQMVPLPVLPTLQLSTSTTSSGVKSSSQPTSSSNLENKKGDAGGSKSISGLPRVARQHDERIPSSSFKENQVVLSEEKMLMTLPQPDSAAISTATPSSSSSTSPAPSSQLTRKVFDPSTCLAQLQQEPYYQDQLIHQQVTQHREGRFGNAASLLSPRVLAALRNQWGVQELYEHQTQAIKACLDGNHVLLLTGTGSGKTLCFASVVAQSFADARGLSGDPTLQGGGFLVNDDSSNGERISNKALFLYPTKALGQDQLRALSSLFQGEGIRIRAVDGDSTPSEREDARLHTDVLLTNPDFLHVTILPQARSGPWKDFISQVSLVVLDEAHTYNGAFGCHISLVLRRLIRLTSTLPRFFMCSATISNPKDTFYKLVGVNENVEDVEVVEEEEEGLVVVEEDRSNSSSSSSFITTKAQIVHPECPSTPPPANSCQRDTAEEDLKDSRMECPSTPPPWINRQEEEEDLKEPRTTIKVNPFLSQRRLTIVTKDSSPQGTRLTAIWRPCFIQRNLRDDVSSSSASAIMSGLLPTTMEDLSEGSSWPMSTEIPSAVVATNSSTEQPRRTSPIFETARILASLVRMGVRTLAFCKTRKLVELVLKYTNVLLKPENNGNDSDHQSKSSTTNKPVDLRGLVVAYRGGYTKEERREIERRMFSGELLGIACTSALELGIDIGTLECVVVLGLSGSASSIAQMFGRAGRKGKNALNIVVPFDGPLDRTSLMNPQRFLDRAKEESAVFDPLNEVILKRHLLCAAKESSPLEMNDGLDGDLFFGGGISLCSFEGEDDDVTGIQSLRRSVMKRYLDQMVEDDLIVGMDDDSLQTTKGRYRLRDKVCKPHDFSLRVMESHSIRLMDVEQHKILDEIDYSRAFFELFPGAIYLHQSRTYCVLTLDLSVKREAFCKRVDVDYYTSAMDRLEVRLVQLFDSRVRWVPGKSSAGEEGAASSPKKDDVAQVKATIGEGPEGNTAFLKKQDEATKVKAIHEADHQSPEAIESGYPMEVAAAAIEEEDRMEILDGSRQRRKKRARKATAMAIGDEIERTTITMTDAKSISRRRILKDMSEVDSSTTRRRSDSIPNTAVASKPFSSETTTMTSSSSKKPFSSETTTMTSSSSKPLSKETTTSSSKKPFSSETTSSSSKKPLSKEREKDVLSTGTVKLTWMVHGFKKRRFQFEDMTELKKREKHPVSLPPLEYSTRAAWIDLEFPRSSQLLNSSGGSLEAFSESSPLHKDSSVAVQSSRAMCWDSEQEKERWGYGIHAAQHLLCKALQQLIASHASSIATTHDASAVPNRLIIFDRDPGGIGIADAAFDRMEEVLVLARRMVKECTCAQGCIDCIYDPHCAELNLNCDKDIAIQVLDHAVQLLLGPEALASGVMNPSSRSTALKQSKLTRWFTPKRIRRAKSLARERAHGTAVVPMWKRHLPELGSEHVEYEREL